MTNAENEQYSRNQAAYRQMKETIKQSYPAGWFVAIGDGGVVGAAASFRDLHAALRNQGHDPRTVLVVEAGVDYPERSTIFV